VAGVQFRIHLAGKLKHILENPKILGTNESGESQVLSNRPVIIESIKSVIELFEIDADEGGLEVGAPALGPGLALVGGDTVEREPLAAPLQHEHGVPVKGLDCWLLTSAALIVNHVREGPGVAGIIRVGYKAQPVAPRAGLSGQRDQDAAGGQLYHSVMLSAASGVQLSPLS
jgi:hypothetical protein